MGLEPTRPRAYASETYMSTIPSPEQSVFVWIYLFCVHAPLSSVAPLSWMLALGGMAPIRFAKSRTSTIPSPEQSVFVLSCFLLTNQASRL